MSKSLAYRIAEKLIKKGDLKNTKPEDWKIVRTRAGKNQLADGAFSFELVNIHNEFRRYGCFEQASYTVKKDIFLSNSYYRGTGWYIEISK